MKQVIGLLDLDPLVYSCAFAAQHKRYILHDDEGLPLLDFRVKQFGSKDWRAIDQDKKDPEVYTSAYSRTELLEAVQNQYGASSCEEYVHVEPVQHSIHMAKAVIQAVIRETQCTEFQGFLSVGQCFRHDIATLQEYKGNRKEMVKPVHYQALRDYFEHHWNAIMSEFYEADDCLSIHAHRSEVTTVIASIDKDLHTVPGWHYVHSKHLAPDERLFENTFEEAMTKFMGQLLTGDKADNIPGIKGIGPKTRDKILSDDKSLLEKFEEVCEVYKKHYGETYEYTTWFGEDRLIDWEDALNEVGKLLWMIRDPKEPLWNMKFFRELIGEDDEQQTSKAKGTRDQEEGCDKSTGSS